MDIDKLTALIIFVITYLGIIFNKLPLLNLNRKTSAYAGSAAMILFGMISFEDAVKSIDFNTIVLLLGMMIIISAEIIIIIPKSNTMVLKSILLTASSKLIIPKSIIAALPAYADVLRLRFKRGNLLKIIPK